MPPSLKVYFARFAVVLAIAAPVIAARAGTTMANPTPAATGIVAQPANGASAQVRWTVAGSAPGWYIQSFDAASGYTGSVWCWACTTIRVPNLTPGHTYSFTVAPMGSSTTAAAGTVLGRAGRSNPVFIGADAVPGAVSGLTATASASDETITITWQPATTGQAADTVALGLWQMPGPTAAGSVTVPAFAGSKTIPVLPGQYTVLAFASNSAGTGPPAGTPWTTVGNPCAAADVCVHVRAGTPTAPERLPAQGLLHSDTNYAGETYHGALTSALHPTQWRLGGDTEAATVAPFQPTETQLLSDFWYNDTARQNGGYAPTPWSNWSGFSTFVTNIVKAAEAGGWAPAYWDLFNEPDLLACSTCSYFSPSDRATVTTGKLLQMLAVEYRAVKAADASAKVVAPSLMAYHDVPGEGDYRIDLSTFVTYAAANGLKLAAISWHENSDSAYAGDWGPGSFPFNVPDHVARARQLLAANPGVGSPVILINEYGTIQTHTLPSWQVGMFRAIEQTAVAGASRSCWNDCNLPGLDGLLAQSGSTWTATMPAYWTARAYADMAGGSTVPADSTASWRVDAVAVRQDPSSTVRVLLGQHWGCAQAVNGWCQSSYPVPAISGQVTIDWPYASPAANFTITRIPAGNSPIAGPTVVSSSRVVVTAGRITLSIPQLADGDAYGVVATAAN